PLRQWAQDYLETFLQELLRLEGHRDHRSYAIYRKCSVEKADHRCRDCFGGGELMCKVCVLLRHKQLSFHRIEVCLPGEWTGFLFKRRALKDLGLRIQIDHWHERHRACPNPSPSAGGAFIIVNDVGVHEVALDYCGCTTSGVIRTAVLRCEIMMVFAV
ncbi:hypothetical protein DFH09DRAFT_924194, partial [Mycena vulgaris]